MRSAHDVRIQKNRVIAGLTRNLFKFHHAIFRANTVI